MENVLNTRMCLECQYVVFRKELPRELSRWALG